VRVSVRAKGENEGEGEGGGEGESDRVAHAVGWRRGGEAAEQRRLSRRVPVGQALDAAAAHPVARGLVRVRVRARARDRVRVRVS